CYTPPARAALVAGCPPGEIQGVGINIQSPSWLGSGVSAGASPANIEYRSPCASVVSFLLITEGDRKAFYENSQWNIKKNKESILRLRQENKKLHQRLADLLAGEEKVIKAAFQEHPTEQGAVKNKTGEIINHRLCEKINQLNNLKHQVEMRKLRLEELQTQYSTKAQEINDMQEMEEGNIEAAKTLRTMENRLEKARFKTEEAVRITNMYKKLKAHMQEESLHFQNKLDALEAEILRLRHELQELENVNTDAQHARNVAREQLVTQEETIYRERKIRDKKLKDIKKMTEEKRAQNERAERRVDVVACFLAQEETFKQLEEMKNENEVSLEQLKEEKDALLHELEHTKYSGEARKVGAQNLMKELRDHLQKEEKRRDATQAELDKVNRVLLNAKAGIEHLASKVQHIKLEDSRFASTELDEKASEYVLDLMAQTEEKLLYLVEFLKNQDKAELLRRIEEVEVSPDQAKEFMVVSDHSRHYNSW
uniref:Outer dynein arm docking complex subunit 3 n=1 Tax=Naja naja TaxID=35670 RepID=A0A8C6XWM6_NAJNA